MDGRAAEKGAQVEQLKKRRYQTRLFNRGGMATSS